MATISIRDLTKSYGKNPVIEHLDLTIQDGLFTVLVGPSGCGKTTLLRMKMCIRDSLSGIAEEGEEPLVVLL